MNSRKFNPRRTKIWLSLLAMLVFLGLAIFAIALEQGPKNNSGEARWQLVQPQRLEEHLGLVGRIDAASRVTLSAPFDGLVADLAVTEGRSVQRGQRLLALDTTQLDIEIRRSLSELLKARQAVQQVQDWEHNEEVARARRALTNSELSLHDTEAKLADTKHLFERGIVARMEVDALAQQLRLQQLNVKSSEAELRAALNKGEGENRQILEMELTNAQARYDALQALRAQRELVSPFAGIALRPKDLKGAGSNPPIQDGQLVTQGTPLLEIANLERFVVIAKVEEADLHQLEQGMPVNITGVGFEGVTLQGHIATIGVQALASDIQRGGTTYEITTALDPLTPSQQKNLRLGMTAQLTIVTYQAKSGLAIPADALHQDQKNRWIVNYRSNMNEAPRTVLVRTGRSFPQGVEVFGLEKGYVEIPATN